MTRRLSRRLPFFLCLRCWLVPLALLTVLAGYLHVVGFPRFVTNRLALRLQQLGYRVEWDRVRLDLVSGIEVEGARFFTQEDLSVPLLETTRMALVLDPLNALSGRPLLTGFRVRGGLFRLAAEGHLEGLREDRRLVLEQIAADVRIDPGGFDVDGLTASCLGMAIHGEGYIVRPDEATLVKDRAKAEWSRPLEQVRNLSPPWVSPLVEQLNAMVFDSMPSAHVDFALHPSRPEENEVVVSVRGGTTRVRGVVFDAWDLDARLTGREVALSRAAASTGQRRVSLSGTMNLKEREAEFHLYNDLPVTHWTSLIPIAWRDRWERAGIHLAGPVKCDVRLGPAPVDKLGEQVAGWCALEKATIAGVAVERAFAHLRRDGDQVTCTNLSAVIGRDAGKGPLEGWLGLDLATGNFRGVATAAFDPNLLLPAMSHRQQQVVRRMRFDDTPPRVAVEFSGHTTNMRSVAWSGHLYATNLFYNGVFLSSFEAPASVQDEVMVMEPLRVLREEGEVRGYTRQHFSEGTVELELESTADPKMVARVIGPAVERLMRLYRVEGPARIEAAGMVDYRTNIVTDLELNVEARDFGVRWFLAETCSFDMHLKGPQLTLTNMTGRLYGGAFEAYANLHGVGHSTNVEYSAAFAFTNIDFAEVVVNLTQSEREPYRGLFSGAGDFSGILGEGRGKTVQGQGSLNIREGYFWQIPLLGGLSHMLSFISPKWDFAAQTDFSATVEARDGKIHSDDVRMEGSLLRMMSEGEYSFSGELDFDVHVEPLREGVVAEVVQKLMSPLTMLIDFHLGGDVDEPLWRSRTLPEKIFGASPGP